MGLHQGGQVSAPVFKRIAEQVLEYMHVPHDVDVKNPQRQTLRAAADKTRMRPMNRPTGWAPACPDGRCADAATQRETLQRQLAAMSRQAALSACTRSAASPPPAQPPAGAELAQACTSPADSSGAGCSRQRHRGSRRGQRSRGAVVPGQIVAFGGGKRAAVRTGDQRDRQRRGARAMACARAATCRQGRRSRFASRTRAVDGSIWKSQHGIGASQALRSKRSYNAGRMNFLQLLDGAEYLAQQGNPPIAGLDYDSRRVKPGWCFVAMRGETTDGNRYIDAALQPARWRW